MLKHLYIQNFILIDEINLDFESGFSAFTGETGAGKSILIDAISTLSLTRASSTLIAKGKDKAIIEATFDLHSNPMMRQHLRVRSMQMEKVLRELIIELLRQV